MTPLSVVVDEDAIASVRAEDESGSFGVLPGHADFLTALAISVVSWKDGADAWHHCALRGGMLAVSAGKDVLVTSREAIRGDDFETLAQTVLARFHADLETERVEQAESTRLHLAAIRQIMQNLRKHGTTGLGTAS